MRELYRRIGALLLFFLAIASFFGMRNALVAVSPLDIGAAYRSTYAPVRDMFPSMHIGKQVIRSSTAFATIPDFIDSKIEGHLTTVTGENWSKLLSGIALSPGETPYADRLAGDTGSLTKYYFLPREAPFAELPAEEGEQREPFRYLRLSTPSGPLYAEMRMEEGRDGISDGAPASLLYPLRRAAAVPLALAAALYLFLPGVRRASGGIRGGADRLTYGKWSAYLLPDMVAFLLAGLFFALPFPMLPEITGNSNVLSLEDGNIWLTLFLWFLAALASLILLWSARYAAFSLELLPQGIGLHTIRRDRLIPYREIRSVEFVDYRPPRWLVGLMLFAGFLNWRLAGQAGLLSSRSDWGAGFRLADGGTVRFLCSGLPGVERLFSTLRKERVPISPDLDELLREAGL